MGGRNNKANNRYGLRNRGHSKHDDVMSINGHGSNDGDKDKEKDDEGNRPHQRRRVDDADDKDPGEVMEVPRVIDFERITLNPNGTEGGHEENNGHRGTLPDNQGQGGGGR